MADATAPHLLLQSWSGCLATLVHWITYSHSRLVSGLCCDKCLTIAAMTVPVIIGVACRGTYSVSYSFIVYWQNAATVKCTQINNKSLFENSNGLPYFSGSQQSLTSTVEGGHETFIAQLSLEAKMSAVYSLWILPASLAGINLFLAFAPIPVLQSLRIIGEVQSSFTLLKCRNKQLAGPKFRFFSLHVCAFNACSTIPLFSS
jgi:hypothetical protein